MLEALAIVSGEISAIQEVTGALSLDIEDITPVYSGATEVTPGDSAQVLSTRGFTLLDDIVVEAIPNNYGKITWNGSVLTVS